MIFNRIKEAKRILDNLDTEEYNQDVNFLINARKELYTIREEIIKEYSIFEYDASGEDYELEFGDESFAILIMDLIETISFVLPELSNLLKMTWASPKDTE